MTLNYDCGGKGHGPNVSEVQWCRDCTPAPARLLLHTLAANAAYNNREAIVPPTLIFDALREARATPAEALLRRWRDASLGGDLSDLVHLTNETTDFLGDGND